MPQTRIYAVINRHNFKLYVGQTVNTLARRLNGHLSAVKKGSQLPFHKALRKYGRRGFDIVELAATDDREYAHFLERLYIALYHSGSNDSGYNASQGGEAPAFGMRHTKDWKREHSAQMAGSNHPLFGVPCSPETKSRMSQTKKGRLVRADVSNQELCNKYAEGLTTRELAAMFHMQRKSIQKRLHAAGCTMRRGGWRRRAGSDRARSAARLRARKREMK